MRIDLFNVYIESGQVMVRVSEPPEGDTTHPWDLDFGILGPVEAMHPDQFGKVTEGLPERAKHYTSKLIDVHLAHLASEMRPIATALGEVQAQHADAERFKKAM